MLGNFDKLRCTGGRNAEIGQVHSRIRCSHSAVDCLADCETSNAADLLTLWLRSLLSEAA
jgi:hypothetical protein